MIELTVNGELRQLEIEGEMPLLWVLRDELGLTGTKFGCGVGACGACTVEVDGAAMRSCVVPLAAMAGKTVRTIEGAADKTVAALQAAWLKHQVPQCGYCQSGMILAAAVLLRGNAQPGDADIDAAITNICRCGTYQRIRAAIHDAAQTLQGAAA
jgi:isoquinoline 1-oxidoreductase alpha subunit